jgi:hypothetical protein
VEDLIQKLKAPEWTSFLYGARTDFEVVTVARRYLAQLDADEQWSLLPEVCQAARISDAVTLAQAALIFAQAELREPLGSPAMALLTPMGSFLSAASMRLASIALRSQRIVAFDTQTTT